MVSFKYVGLDELEIPAARMVVKPGDTFDVVDDVAAGLVGQDIFEKVTTTKAAAKAQKED